MHADDFVCLSDDDGLKHIDNGNTGIRTFRREKYSVVEPCVWSWDRSHWTVNLT